MPTVSLDEFMALNDQLAALWRAGLPVDAGLDLSEPDASAALERINASVARRVRQGATLSQALDDDEQFVPQSYRFRLQAALQTGGLAAALSGFTGSAQSFERSWQSVRAGLLYPLVVCVFAYAGLICLCLFFGPQLSELYREMRMEPGAGLRILQWLRHWLPYWATVFPVVALLVTLWSLRRRSRRTLAETPAAGALGWLPGMTYAVYCERCASFAETLAALLRNQTEFPKSLLLAGGMSGDAGLRAGANELAETLRRGQTPAVDGATALRFPPFLRWALLNSEASAGKELALDMAATLYRDFARRRGEQLRLAAPMVACVFIGGGVTLLYGLLLFLPIVELLHQLAR